ncbi:MAG TPA: hypothetical protein VHD56_08630 [Tepidisphaeraceae bacterium]|nr:hypothetical protein [Tepidisphaeraceae bacterium]
MNRLLSVVAMGLIGWTIAGCDRAPAPPPAAIQAQAQAKTTEPAEVRPTTQELISGEYQKLALPNMPLTIRVPKSWKINYTTAMTFLEGPTPSDQATIQLAQRDAIPADRFDPMLDRLKTDEPSNAPPGRLLLKPLGSARVLDRISIGKPISSPKLDFRGNPVSDDKGEPINIIITPISWTVTVFVPDPAGFLRYELNLIGMTAEQYTADKDLLEKIFNSLSFEAITPTTLP